MRKTKYYPLLAKAAVENYITKGIIIDPPENLPKELLERRSGVFVTLEKQGRNENEKELRGCIGTYLPTKENVAKEIISNAISAATMDYRFEPVSKNELPLLKYTVSLLEEPKRIKDLKELNPKKYGILVRNEAFSKTGLLLPDIEGVDTVEQQISIACQKAGIDLNQEKFFIYKFTVEKYE